ncbi:Cytochrome c [Rosistilla oblonga]|nr:Cytochrome c [Rosistilla oblonga]
MHGNRSIRNRLCVLFSSLILLSGGGLSAQEAQWIWAPGFQKDSIPEGRECYFRKSFNVRAQVTGRVTIAADDQYELFVNGRRVGAGSSARKLDEFNITRFLAIGRNVVAVKVVNQRGSTAALAARVQIQAVTGGQWFSFSSDESWVVANAAQPMWQTALYNDRRWLKAQSFGQLGSTIPWDRQADVVAEQSHQNSERFMIQPGFTVQRVFDDEEVGSVIAMAFNEFGHIIASQENGPLLLIFDRDGDSIPEEVRTYCDKVQSCQGILALNGEVFVTGYGPDGAGMYRLSDRDRNGTLEQVRLIVKFKGNPGEHGGHGLTLGPDGMIYCVVGNHVHIDADEGPGTTLKSSYEGDLVPKYEDPGGHAMGVKAPGGIVFRTDIEGRSVQRVAGGLRNAYDLAFHPDGGLFVHDSDMESDVGATWYRPTLLFEAAEGAEFGWRSGWSKWPEYYLDRVPSVLETGRGSPTGATIYEHFAFPAKYQNSLFLADWSEGRILAVDLKKQGAGYTADSEVFLQGQPLNVTDLAVGPQGALYFATGGRGTAGGIYRVLWDGEIPERVKNLGNGVAAAIRQPQLDSAYARQKIAGVQKELGDEWGELVAGVAFSDDNPPHYRTRAMNLMQLFGPLPSEELILELSKAKSEAVRIKAAEMMGLNPGEQTTRRLTEMLADTDPSVCRAACEALLRSGENPPAEQLIPLLADHDRQLAFAARRLLEQIPMDQWQEMVLQSDEPRVAIVGGLALVTRTTDKAVARAVLAKMSNLMEDFLSDGDFIDLLRVTEVALHRGKVRPADVPELRERIAEEFPTGEPRMNREIVRLCAYLQATSIVERAMEYLRSDVSEEDRTHVAMHLQFIEYDWTPEQRFELIRFYEEAALAQSGSSYPLYMMNVTRDFGKHLTEQEARVILEEGSKWPNAALAAIYKLPRPIDTDTAAMLRDLDLSISNDQHTSDVYRRLRTGIVAMLAMAGDEDSQAHLRKIWREEPERRTPVAMGLALYPDGENWDYLVRSLNILEPAAAVDVLSQLSSVEIATDDPEALRQVILLGLRAIENGASPKQSLTLLEHWTGFQPTPNAKEPMRPWQDWYARSYPNKSAAELPGEDESKWDMEQLLDYLRTDEGRVGDPSKGRQLFTAAQCISCHRFGNQGESVGPDLTQVSRRFTKQEVVESILYPSHVISDQYQSKRVMTLDGKVYSGLMSASDGDHVTIRDIKNQVVVIPKQDIDQIQPSTTSTMPAGLLDTLSLSEISDLLSYLGVLPATQVAESTGSTQQR